MSQNFILYPLLITASAVAIQVFTGTIISEFFFKFKDLIAISNASVPFPTLTQYFAPTNFLKLFSNFKTSSPPENCEFLIELCILLKIFFLL